jgi:hypothetical protein
MVSRDSKSGNASCSRSSLSRRSRAGCGRAQTWRTATCAPSSHPTLSSRSSRPGPWFTIPGATRSAMDGTRTTTTDAGRELHPRPSPIVPYAAADLSWRYTPQVSFCDVACGSGKPYRGFRVDVRRSRDGTGVRRGLDIAATLGTVSRRRPCDSRTPSRESTLLPSV